MTVFHECAMTMQFEYLNEVDLVGARLQYKSKGNKVPLYVRDSRIITGLPFIKHTTGVSLLY